MSGFSTEVFVEITNANEQPGSGFRVLAGNGVPGGDTGPQDAAALSSIYGDRTSGKTYKKINNVGAASDWEEIGNVVIDQLKWRNEKVILATVDTVPDGAGFDLTTLSDNESAIDGDAFAIGQYLISDVDGVPVLKYVSAKVSATSVTIATATQIIADNDTFIVQNYLPDTPAAQEKQAIIHFPLAGSPGIKIADFNWALADGITLNGYADSNGSVLGTDTVQVAIQKLEKGLKDSLLVLGVSRNDQNLGAFTGGAALYLTATESVKTALQKIGVRLAKQRGVSATGITAQVAVDSIPIADARAVKWELVIFDETTPANGYAVEVYAMHDGTSAVDKSIYAKLKTGSGISGTVDVDVSGGNLRLLVSASAASTAHARRHEVAKDII